MRSWTHLERQRGGFGFLGGPGETQIEADRRVIEERIARIEAELEKVKRTRNLHRDSRKRVPYPIVALVGYTNAGKSTLFNRLTGASVLRSRHAVRDARSDACARSSCRTARKIILSDTVGFISDLPTMLVAAFRATLEEVIEADVILHVRDISHEDTRGAAARRRGRAARARHRSERRRERRDRGLEQDRPARRRRPRAARQPGGAQPAEQPAGAGLGADRARGSTTLLAAIEDAARARRRSVLDLALDPADGAGAELASTATPRCWRSRVARRRRSSR